MDSSRTTMVVMTPASPSARGGQQDAPGEGVDRRPADQGVVVGVPVDGGQPGEVGQEHQHHRYLVEVLGEPARTRAAVSAIAAAPSIAVRSRRRSVTTAHGVSPAPTWARYSYHPGR